MREKKVSLVILQGESPNYESLVDHNLNNNSNSRENEIMKFSENGQLASKISSGNNLKHLSGEISGRIPQEMKGLLGNVNVQIQRAISHKRTSFASIAGFT